MKKQLAQTAVIVGGAVAFGMAGSAYGDIFTIALMLLVGGFSGAVATAVALTGDSPFVGMLPACFFTIIALAGSPPHMNGPIFFSVVAGLAVGSAALFLACSLPSEDEDDGDF